MFEGLYSAASGMEAQQHQFDAISNDMANLDTAGYKSTVVGFRDLLYSNGGEINVATNDARDKDSLEQIRMHLGHIAKMFSAGNFNAPMLIHDTTPPGVPTMQRLKADIRYDYSETPKGARIRLITANSQAVDAIHAFLLFQIIDHHTGDSPAIIAEPHQ